MTWAERMRDSEFAPNIPTSWGGIVAGYLPYGDQANAWSVQDWARFPGRPKLPIFVRINPQHPIDDAFVVIRNLHYLGVPAGKGIRTALDLETVKSATSYVTEYGSVLNWAGFRVHPYGSASTIFTNPALDGRWVADYAGTGPFMYPDATVAMTQYASPSTGSGGQWDSSTARDEVQAGPWWV